MAALQGPTDDTAWEAMLREQMSRNGRLFYRLAFGVLRDHEAVEDVCQQAMLKAWECRDELRQGAALRNWLARVIVNRSIQARRRRSVERKALANHSREPAFWDEAFHGDERTDAVLAAMDRLPEQVRVVVALRLMQGVSGNEVKELLGLSAPEVSRLLHRGMEMLRGILADWQPA
ncbi:MAG TPA: sigma-70 family RNA polymerase sigma factor [Tepidisphaeraceae bacterium]|jgi:RNA polymerase sigma-70 factor (ECF subfamily)|nr:sigma-70 family RNA polymerase sigma factor [Tepidisphaeraceae bacterium]